MALEFGGDFHGAGDAWNVFRKPALITAWGGLPAAGLSLNNNMWASTACSELNTETECSKHAKRVTLFFSSIIFTLALLCEEVNPDTESKRWDIFEVS